MRAPVVATLSSLLLAPMLSAQLIKNINVVPQGGVGAPTDSDPGAMARVGNRLYFAATSVAAGRELFWVDASGAPAQLLADLEPGNSGSDPADMIALPNGRLLFTASTAASGREVWVSDGTAAGTSMLSDISGPGEFNMPSSLVVHQGNGYFLARPSGAYSLALWRTDGTSAGTVQIDDLGLTGGYSNLANLLVSAGPRLFFTAAEGAFTGSAVTGIWRLYTSDGTVGGKQLVWQQAESNPYGPRELTAIGSRVVFSAQGLGTGLEPWVSDGTPAGTAMVELIAGSDGSNPSDFIVVGNRVFFAAYASFVSGEVFVSDGTVVGTVQVTSATAQFRRPLYLHRVGNRCGYLTDDGVHGNELWTTHATPGTETLVVDLVPGIGGSDPSAMIGFGGGILFSATTAATGAELFFTNGTASGTSLVADIRPGTASSNPGGFAELGGMVFFRATHPLSGTELWVTDGTPAGTRLHTDIAAPPTDMASFASSFVSIGDRALFRATDGLSGNELWVTDGTTAGTQRLTDFNGAGSSMSFGPGWIIEFDGRAILQVDDGVHGVEPWISDGTVAGTRLLADLVPGTGSSTPRSMLVWRGELYFAAGNLANQQLYATDGTTAGTRLVSAAMRVADLNAVPHQGRLYFAASTATSATELWSTDGTTAGTAMVVELAPGLGSSMGGLDGASFGGLLYFTANGANGDRELWVTDGSAAGTMPFANINPSTSSWPVDYRVIGSRLVFGAYTGSNYQYFSTDGAAVQQLSFPPLFLNTNWSLSDNGDRLIAMMRGANFSFELWGTDGTVAGSGVIKQIHPDGTEYVNMRSWRVSSGRKLLFSAADSTVGNEIFVTDGTAAGTGVLTDLRPGPDDSLPEDVVRIGDQLVFGAYDPQVGFELFGLPFALVDDWVAMPLGIGCAGSNGVAPRLGTTGSATPGSLLTVELTDAAALSPVLHFQSPGQARLDLGPCAIQLETPLFAAASLSDGAGAASLPVNVPNAPGLIGLGLWLQSLVLDAGGEFAGFASVGPALEIRIGS
jgi:ELWxxDGT repeat protein